MKVSKNKWKDIIWWRDSLLYRFVYPTIFRDSKGISILDEKWNNLIILDACRYDYFCKAIKNFNINGNLEYRISKGSDTTKFLLNNFDNEYYDDIVYITSNPFVDKIMKNKFYKIVSVWKYGWDDRYQTVHPKVMYHYTLKTILNNTNKNKRYIIHFIQPHYPYLTYKVNDCSFNELRLTVLTNNERKVPLKYKCIYKIYGMNIYALIDDSTHKSIYYTNLKIALSYVEKLTKFLTGRTIITADHGEAFGERLHKLIPIKVYGHPPNIRIPVLIKVPWFVIDNKDEVNIKELKKEILKTKSEVNRISLKKKLKKLKIKHKI